MTARSIAPHAFLWTLVAASGFGCGQPSATRVEPDGGSTTPWPASTLVQTRDEPFGQHCAAGGVRLESGPDEDEDGMLSASEVTSTSFVCNGMGGGPGTQGVSGTPGSDAPPGNDGKKALLRIEKVAPSKECVAGGAIVMGGIDDDADGLLSEAEIDSQETICNGSEAAPPACAVTSAATVTVKSAADLAQLAGCTELSGNLVVEGTQLTDLEALSSLRVIRGKLELRNNARLTNLDGLRNLTVIGRGLYIRDSPSLTNVGGLASLATVENLYFYNCPLLTSLVGLSGLDAQSPTQLFVHKTSIEDLSGLEGHVWNGRLTLDGNPRLRSLVGLQGFGGMVQGIGIVRCDALADLTGLEGVTGVESELYIMRNATLRDVEALSNVKTGMFIRVRVENNPALTSLSGLRSLTGPVQQVSVYDNDQLHDLTGLQGISNLLGQLHVVGNDNVASLDAVSGLTLDRNATLTISQNVLLPQCQADAFAARVQKACSCGGNDATAVCAE